MQTFVKFSCLTLNVGVLKTDQLIFRKSAEQCIFIFCC